jgi:hypothetical protein
MKELMMTTVPMKETGTLRGRRLKTTVPSTGKQKKRRQKMVS